MIYPQEQNLFHRLKRPYQLLLISPAFIGALINLLAIWLFVKYLATPLGIQMDAPIRSSPNGGILSVIIISVVIIFFLIWTVLAYCALALYLRYVVGEPWKKIKLILRGEYYPKAWFKPLMNQPEVCVASMQLGQFRYFAETSPTITRNRRLGQNRYKNLLCVGERLIACGRSPAFLIRLFLGIFLSDIASGWIYLKLSDPAKREQLFWLVVIMIALFPVMAFAIFIYLLRKRHRLVLLSDQRLLVFDDPYGRTKPESYGHNQISSVDLVKPDIQGTKPGFLFVYLVVDNRPIQLTTVPTHEANYARSVAGAQTST